MDFTLDFSHVTTKEELHALLKKTLPLPDYYGNNLDSLYDVLTEGHEEWNITITNWEKSEEALGRYFLTFKGTLSAAREDGARIGVQIERSEKKNESLKKSLEIEQVNAFWGDHEVLRSISLKLESGDFHFLTGPNGSGKSTLLSIMAGVQIPTLRVQKYGSRDKKGTEVLLEGTDIKTFSRKILSQKIAYLSQYEERVWDYSVREVVLNGRFCRTGFNAGFVKEDFEVTDACMEAVGITELSERSVCSLSGGEWQKVRIARALCQEPDFMLLDEPVANLDFGFQDELLTFLQKLSSRKKIGLLVSIHDLNLAARFAKKMTLLKKINRLAQGEEQYFTGSPSEVMNVELLEKTYGTSFASFIHPGFNTPEVYVKGETLNSGK